MKRWGVAVLLALFAAGVVLAQDQSGAVGTTEIRITASSNSAVELDTPDYVSATKYWVWIDNWDSGYALLYESGVISLRASGGAITCTVAATPALIRLEDHGTGTIKIFLDGVEDTNCILSDIVTSNWSLLVQNGSFTTYRYYASLQPTATPTNTPTPTATPEPDTFYPYQLDCTLNNVVLGAQGNGEQHGEDTCAIPLADGGYPVAAIVSHDYRDNPNDYDHPPTGEDLYTFGLTSGVDGAPDRGGFTGWSRTNDAATYCVDLQRESGADTYGACEHLGYPAPNYGDIQFPLQEYTSIRGNVMMRCTGDPYAPTCSGQTYYDANPITIDQIIYQGAAPAPAGLVRPLAEDIESAIYEVPPGNPLTLGGGGLRLHITGATRTHWFMHPLTASSGTLQTSVLTTVIQ